MKNMLEKIKKNYSDNKPGIYIVLGIWLITIIITLFVYRSSLGYGSTGNSNVDNYVEINKDTSIKQVLTINKDTTSIGLMFGTYRRSNKGNVYITIVGNSGNVYVDEKINVNSLLDNAYHIFSLSDLNDEEIIISIKSDSENGQGVCTYYSSEKINGTLLINNEEVEGTISYRLILPNASLHKFYLIVIIAVISLLSLLLMWLFLFKPKYENFFALFVFVLGLIFMAIITPLSPPDEGIHYEYVLQESNLLMGNKDVYDIDHNYIDYLVDKHYANTKNDKEAYIDIVDNLNNPYVDSGVNIDAYDVDIYDANSYTYIAQSIGVIIARLLKLNPLKVFYAGRLTNLLFYCLCIYISIKNVPTHKVLFGIIASLPMFIQQAASYSYDSFVNALCFVLIGFLIKWLNSEEPIKVVDYIVCFIVLVLISKIKYIYNFLAFLYWLVPSRKFKNKTQKILFSLGLCIPMIMILSPILIPRLQYMLENMLFNKVDAEGPSEVVEENPYYTMSYVVNNFSKTIKLIIKTVRYNLSSWFYGSIGKYLSQLTLILPMPIIYGMIASIIACALVKQDTYLTISNKIVILIVCVAVAMFSIGGMLFSETRINDEYIGGLQGRYYSPLLPYFFVCFSNKKFNISKKCNEYIILAYMILIFETIVYIMSYTFIN